MGGVRAELFADVIMFAAMMVVLVGLGILVQCCAWQLTPPPPPPSSQSSGNDDKDVDGTNSTIDPSHKNKTSVVIDITRPAAAPPISIL